ncbi:unnamed protein product, partial [Polarella glacialis]
MASRAIVWFRNDLRVRDNQLLQYAEVRGAAELVAIYCVDPRHFEPSPFGDYPRTGRFRAQFLAESVQELRTSLQRIGSCLLVVSGRPEDAIPAMFAGGNAVLAFQNEDTLEEQQVEDEVLKRIPRGTTVMRHWGKTLLHRDDLGWNPKETLPLPFGKFLHETCHRVKVRAEVPTPAQGDLPPFPESLQELWA